MTGSSSSPEHAHTLDRTLGLFGNAVTILGAVSPVGTIFVFVPVFLFLFGGFTWPALLLGFLLQIPMALCYAELGSAYPLAGGEYSMIGRSVSRGSGFGVFALMMTLFVTLLPTMALGAGQSLQVIWAGADPRIVALVVIAAGAFLGVLNIKEGAIFSGVFLACQLIAIAIVVVLGITHAHAPAPRLLSTEVFAPDGSLIPLSLKWAVFSVGLGFLMMWGYGNAVVFGEETTDARKHMGRAVLIPLVVQGVLILLGAGALMVGAPSLKALATAPAPVSYFIETLAGGTLNKIVGGLVFLALTEAVMITCLIVGRELWSASRDNAWPTPVSRVLATLHPRYKSPWVATLAYALMGAPLVFVSLASLATIQGVVAIVACGGIAIGALRIRFLKSAPADRWKMPLWPLPPIVALIALVLVLSQQTRHDLIICGAVLAVAVVYYLAFLKSRPTTHWVMADVEEDGSLEVDVLAQPLPVPAES
jgi:amino acid transporter